MEICSIILTSVVMLGIVLLIVLLCILTDKSKEKHEANYLESIYKEFKSSSDEGNILIKQLWKRATPIEGESATYKHLIGCCYFEKGRKLESRRRYNYIDKYYSIGKINGKYAINYIPLLNHGSFAENSNYKVYYRPVSKDYDGIYVGTEKIEYEFIFQDMNKYNNWAGRL